jgi:hypothetical protein
MHVASRSSSKYTSAPSARNLALISATPTGGDKFGPLSARSRHRPAPSLHRRSGDDAELRYMGAHQTPTGDKVPKLIFGRYNSQTIPLVVTPAEGLFPGRAFSRRQCRALKPARLRPLRAPPHAICLMGFVCESSQWARWSWAPWWSWALFSVVQQWVFLGSELWLRPQERRSKRTSTQARKSDALSSSLDDGYSLAPGVLVVRRHENVS